MTAQNINLATLWVDIKVKTENLNQATQAVTGGGSFKGLVPALNMSYWSIRATNTALNVTKDILKKAIQDAIDLEYQFMRIERVARELKGTNFRSEALKLARDLSGIDYRQVNEGLEQAAKLGIKGQENMLAFTKTIAMFATVSGMEASSATESMGKIQAIYNIDPRKMDHLANAILAVADNTSLSEQNLMKMLEQTGNMTKQFGLTIPQTLALSTTMQQLGMPFEIARTSLVKFLGELKNPEKVKKAFKMTNEEVDAFMVKLSENPFEGLLEAFARLEVLRKTQGGIPYNEALEALSLNMPRYKNSISTLVDNQALLVQILDAAENGWYDNVRLMIQYTEQAETTKAKLNDLSEAWSLLLARLGDTDFVRSQLRGLNDDLNALSYLIGEFKGNEVDFGNIEEVEKRIKELKEGMQDFPKVLIPFINANPVEAIIGNSPGESIKRLEMLKYLLNPSNWKFGQGLFGLMREAGVESEKKLGSENYKEYERLVKLRDQLKKSEEQKKEEAEGVVTKEEGTFKSGDYLRSLQDFGFKRYSGLEDIYFSNFEDRNKEMEDIQKDQLTELQVMSSTLFDIRDNTKNSIAVGD